MVHLPPMKNNMMIIVLLDVISADPVTDIPAKMKHRIKVHFRPILSINNEANSPGTSEATTRIKLMYLLSSPLICAALKLNP